LICAPPGGLTDEVVDWFAVADFPIFSDDVFNLLDRNESMETTSGVEKAVKSATGCAFDIINLLSRPRENATSLNTKNLSWLPALSLCRCKNFSANQCQPMLFLIGVDISPHL
jgi:hypothetical protein